MEKMIKKMMVAGLACWTMCGTTMAAPRVAAPIGQPSAGGYPKGGNGPHTGRAPEAKRMVQQAPKAAQKAPVAAHAPTHSYGVASKQNNRPTKQVARHTTPQPAAHHAPAPMQVTHHPTPHGYAEAGKPARRPATPCHRHHRHECNDCHYDDNGWIEVGAGIIGGLIGALIAG